MERVLRAGLTGLSAAALLAFIAVAVSRMGHPMPLEPAESVWLSETSRVLHGQPLMAEPSLAYIPLPAMPGFALLAALFGAFVGPQLWVLRLIAMLSTLGTAWLVSARGEGGDRKFCSSPGSRSGSCSPHSRRAAADWILARPEALAWFLALAGLATLRFTTGAWGAMGAATLLALAFFTAAHTRLVRAHRDDSRRASTIVHGAWPSSSGSSATFGGGIMLLLAMARALVRVLRLGRSLSLDPSGSGPARHHHRHRARGDPHPAGASVLMAAALPASLWLGRNGIWMWSVIGGALAAIVGAVEPSAISLASDRSWSRS
jgi:hypothetical protein